MKTKSKKNFDLNFNTACNLRCLYCNYLIRRPATEEEIKDASLSPEQRIEEAKKNGYSWLYLSNGEPTVSPKLLGCIKFAHSIGLKVLLGTNAYKFSSKTYAKSILRERIDSILTTIHGSDPRTHDAITRVNGSYGKTMQGIKNIVDYHGSKKFKVTIVITRLNYRLLTNMAEQLYALGVRRIVFSGLVNRDGRTQHPSLLVDLTKVQLYLGRAVTFCQKHNITFGVNGLPFCMALEYYIPHKFNSDLENPDLVKVKGCEGCHFAKKCGGIDKTTLMKYGTPEFMKTQSVY